MELKDIKVLPRFRDKIPPQTEEQFKQLEENILTEGRVREPLTIWKGHSVLVDGHHRKRVLDEHPEIPFTIDEMEFADEDAVDEWIIKNQLGKRNLTEPQYKYLRGLYYHKRQGTLGGDRKSNPQKKDLKSEGFDKTSQVVAKELGVSPNAVEQAGAYAHGLDRAAKVDPEFRTEVLTGKTTAKMKDIAAIRKLDSDEEVKAAIEEIRNPIVSKVTSRTSGSKDQRIFNERLNAISAEMEKPKGGYTLDDAIRDLNSAEDVFINQIEFILRARKSVLDADERTKKALTGYIESVIHDLEELKGRI